MRRGEYHPTLRAGIYQEFSSGRPLKLLLPWARCKKITCYYWCVLCGRMSDLAAPFLQVFEGDTVLAFWCFAGMMLGVRDNFSASEVGIRRRLGHLAHLLAKVTSLPSCRFSFS